MDLLLAKNLIKKKLSPKKRKSLADYKSDKFTALSDENEKCPICLVIPIDNKSFANKCFHSFCKVCIVEWSKMKTECPLCRQPYSAIIYDVQSEYDFKELKISAINSKFNQSNSPFSRIFNFNLRHPYYDSATLANQVVANQVANRIYEVGTLEHRRHIYSFDLYVLPCGNGDRSRRRRCDPQFFRQNPACEHRLLPFLNLELRAIIPNLNERNSALTLIMKSLKTISIISSRFQLLISQYTSYRTIHFIHEFYNFAISTYDIDQYYRRAIYVPRNQADVVQIRYDYDDLFDLSDPYNYRLSRGIYNNDINSYRSAFSSTVDTTNNLSTNRPSANNSANNLIRNLEQVEESSNSDSDVIFDGIHSVDLTKKKNKDKPKSSASAKTKDKTELSTADDTDNPMPGPSGLQNNQSNLTLNQLRTHYTDDSDSDYDDDTYFSNSKNSHLPFYESETEENHFNQLNQLKRDLEDTDDDDSIEYVGYVKPRHLRTPEIIEISEDEDDEEKNKLNVQKEEFNPTIKRLKTLHEPSTVNESNEEVNKCRCKIKCKDNKCKRASV